jgi:hypothetical protein
MTVPALPFDSLYKFVFITGIILILFGFYRLDKMNSALKYNKYTRDSLNVEETSDSLDFERIVASNALIAKSIQKSHPIANDERLEMMRLNNKDLENNRKKLRYNRLVSIKAIYRLDVITFDKLEMMGLMVLASVLFVYGFVKWNYIQKLQDQILKFQRDIVELEYIGKEKGTDKTKYRKP